MSFLRSAHILNVLIALMLNNGISVFGNPSDWKTIETLAEEHPYVVAILSSTKAYVCTGTIIHKRTVLTSGGCINAEPNFVAVGTAIFNSQVNNNSIFKILYTKLHGNFIFDLQEIDFSVKRMHSNIGLVFILKPVLNLFIESAKIGNYFTPELKDKKLIMVGYGIIDSSESIVLQQQAYQQIACKNPKWYYCVCGIEYSDITYEKPFGEGAPVLYNNLVIGISARQSGTLTLNRNVYYNIFTILAPYLPWIEKSKSEFIMGLKDGIKMHRNGKDILKKSRVIVLILTAGIYNIFMN